MAEQRTFRLTRRLEAAIGRYEGELHLFHAAPWNSYTYHEKCDAVDRAAQDVANLLAQQTRRARKAKK